MWFYAFILAISLFCLIIIYSALVWIKGLKGNNPITTLLAPLRKVQNIGLRRISGVYKAASILSLKQEIKVEPINLYLEKPRLHQVDKDKRGLIIKVLEKY